MKFKSIAFPNMEIRYNGKKIKFKDGFYETEDKDIIDMLKQDKSIIAVTSVTETVSKRTKITQTTADQE